MKKVLVICLGFALFQSANAQLKSKVVTEIDSALKQPISDLGKATGEAVENGFREASGKAQGAFGIRLPLGQFIQPIVKQTVAALVKTTLTETTKLIITISKSQIKFEDKHIGKKSLQEYIDIATDSASIIAADIAKRLADENKDVSGIKSEVKSSVELALRSVLLKTIVRVILEDPSTPKEQPYSQPQPSDTRREDASQKTKKTKK